MIDRIFAELQASPATAIRKQLKIQLEESGRRGDCVLRMHGSFNLYLSDEQAEVYLETISTAPFERQLYRPLITLLQECTAELVALPPGLAVDFIDLGPGVPDKSLPLVDYLDAMNPGFRYVPVDISRKFLSLTVGYFRYRRFEIVPIRSLFEILPDSLEEDRRFVNRNTRLVNIGMTFNNYAPDEISAIIAKLIDADGVGLIATQVTDEIGPDDSVAPYKEEDAAIFNFKMLEMAGLSRNDFVYSAVFHNERVEMAFEAKSKITLDDLVIPVGARILTSISYRYSTERLRFVLGRFFKRIEFFTLGQSGVCAVRLEGARQ